MSLTTVPGVPEEIKDRLFSPLVSGRDGGSGLGSEFGTNFHSTASWFD
jgi:two-component system nitrogen regulation sensor histidine kinase GlnL